MDTNSPPRKRPAPGRSTRRRTKPTPRGLLAAVVVAATVSSLAGIAGHALALNALDWPPHTRSSTAGAAGPRQAQHRVSLPRETAAERHDILRQRTREAGVHRAQRAANASPYRYRVPPNVMAPRSIAPPPANESGGSSR